MRGSRMRLLGASFLLLSLLSAANAAKETDGSFGDRDITAGAQAKLDGARALEKKILNAARPIMSGEATPSEQEYSYWTDRFKGRAKELFKDQRVNSWNKMMRLAFNQVRDEKTNLPLQFSLDALREAGVLGPNATKFAKPKECLRYYRDVTQKYKICGDYMAGGRGLRKLGCPTRMKGWPAPCSGGVAPAVPWNWKIAGRQQLKQQRRKRRKREERKEKQQRRSKMLKVEGNAGQASAKDASISLHQMCKRYMSLTHKKDDRVKSEADRVKSNVKRYDSHREMWQAKKRMLQTFQESVTSTARYTLRKDSYTHKEESFFTLTVKGHGMDVNATCKMNFFVRLGTCKKCCCKSGLVHYDVQSQDLSAGKRHCQQWFLTVATAASNFFGFIRLAESVAVARRCSDVRCVKS